MCEAGAEKGQTLRGESKKADVVKRLLFLNLAPVTGLIF